MKFSYKIIFSDGTESIRTIDTDNSDFKDMIGSLNGIYIDYKNPDYSNEKHLINYDDSFTDIDESDFHKIGEAVKQRPDYEEVIQYLKDAFGYSFYFGGNYYFNGNYYFKNFMYDFFNIEEV